jgi:hypothetical protein
MWRQYTTGTPDLALPLGGKRSPSEELIHAAAAQGIRPPAPKDRTPHAKREALREWKDRLSAESRSLEYYAALRRSLGVVSPEPSDVARSPRKGEGASAIASPIARAPDHPDASGFPAFAGFTPRRAALSDRRVSTSPKWEELGPSGSPRHHHHRELSMLCPVCATVLKGSKYALEHMDRCVAERERLEGLLVPFLEDEPGGGASSLFNASQAHGLGRSLAQERAPLAALRRLLIVGAWEPSAGPDGDVFFARRGVRSDGLPRAIAQRLARLSCPMGCFCRGDGRIASHREMGSHAADCWQATFIERTHDARGAEHDLTHSARVTVIDETVGSLVRRAFAASGRHAGVQSCAVVRQCDDATVPLDTPVWRTWAMWFVVFVVDDPIEASPARSSWGAGL